MRSKLFTIVVFLICFLAWTPASMLCSPQQTSAHPQRKHHIRRRSYVRHRTKLQHLKIIGGTAKTGASIGGLVGGPPGMAVGAAAGAAAGTAYDLKTRKVKARN
jgi:uncharacterized protein YcfJ